MSTYENAPSTTLLATHCALCGRALRDADRVERGVGPDCADKHGYSAAPQGPADWLAAVAALGPRSGLFGSAGALTACWGVDARRAANILVHRAACLPRDARGPVVDALAALGYHRLAVALEAAAGEVVRVATTEAGALAVEAPYNPAFTQALKAARIGARWSPETKVWVVPQDRKAKAGLYKALRLAFAGVLLEGPKGPVRLTVEAALRTRGAPRNGPLRAVWLARAPLGAFRARGVEGEAMAKHKASNDNRPSKARQDEVTRRRRLREGRCPTHGLSMGQVGVWEENGEAGPVVACPRRDCEFQHNAKE